MSLLLATLSHLGIEIPLLSPRKEDQDFSWQFRNTVDEELQLLGIFMDPISLEISRKETVDWTITSLCDPPDKSEDSFWSNQWKCCTIPDPGSLLRLNLLNVRAKEACCVGTEKYHYIISCLFRSIAFFPDNPAMVSAILAFEGHKLRW